MYESPTSAGVPKQIWFVVAMAVVLAAVVVSGALGWNPIPPQLVQRQVARISATAQPSVTPSATPEPSPTLTRPGPTSVVLPPIMTSTPEATALNASGMPTPRPSLHAAVTPFPSQERTFVDHYWLGRPVGHDAQRRMDRFYPYGSRGDGTYPVHHGVEFVNPMGTILYAVADGRVVVAGEDELQVHGARDGFYGLLVIMELAQRYEDEPVYVAYGHLSQIDVSVGQTVSAGDPVGRVGMSGIAEGPHVHFEVRLGENDYRATVNPDLWVEPLPRHGTIAGELLSADGGPAGDVRLVLYRQGSTTPYRYLTSYPLKGVNADPAWGENLCTGDVPEGNWVLQAWHQGAVVSGDVVVREGQTSWVSLRLPW